MSRLEHYKKYRKGQTAFVKKETTKVKDLVRRNKSESEPTQEHATSPSSSSTHKSSDDEDQADERWRSDSKWRSDILFGRVKDAAVKVIPGAHRSENTANVPSAENDASKVTCRPVPEVVAPDPQSGAIVRTMEHRTIEATTDQPPPTRD